MFICAEQDKEIVRKAPFLLEGFFIFLQLQFDTFELDPIFILGQQSTVDVPRAAIENPETQKIHVHELEERTGRQPGRQLLERSPALGPVESEQVRNRHFPGRQDSPGFHGFIRRVPIVFRNPGGQSFAK